jgi:hypothetical protein
MSTASRADSTLCFTRSLLVPRRAWAEVRSVEEELLAVRSPVILTGALASTPFAANTAAELRERIGAKPVAAYFVDDEAQPTLGEPTERRHEILAFDEFVARSGGLEPLPVGARRYYLTQCRDVIATYPALADAVRQVPVPGPVSESNIFCGSPRSSVGTHQDPGVHAFLAQVVGEKRVILFAPPMAPFLYPHSLRSFNAVHSRVKDVDAPDLERFPLFSLAVAHVGVLGPGEILYIPPFWWHNIRTLTWSFSLSFFSPDPEFVKGSHLYRCAQLAAGVAAELDGMSPYYAELCAARIAAELMALR